MSKTEKTDVYAEVTDKITDALRRGVVPWSRPWTAGTNAHRNPVSGTEYRGINPFLLEMTASASGYSDPRWMTFRQAKTKGGAVRKGERSTLVIFWKMIKGRDDETGKLKTIPLLRHYRVFNVAQCDGLDLEPIETPAPFEPIETAARMVDEMPNAPAIHHGGRGACYVPALDVIQMPHAEQFVDAAAYYATTFHELAHSTGHASRLARKEVTRAGITFGDDDYSREELTAELAAAMLCGVAGISAETVERSAAYIDNWLSALANDPKMLVAAGGRAQRAADCIRGIVAAKKEETPLAVAA